jgi:hypothetical protein
MEYVVEIGSGAKIPSFIKIDSGIQKLIGGYTDICFVQNKESGLKVG